MSKCPRGYDPCRQIGCSCPIENQPMDKIDAELIAAGIDPERLAHETSVLVRVMKEKYELQAKLDRVTELVGKWRALVQEDIGLLCGECVTNCADDLEQALKEGEK